MHTQMQYQSPISSGLKVIAKIKVCQTSRSRSKIMIPCDWSCHKKYACALGKPYHFLFESYDQGKSCSNFKVKNYGSMWKVLSQGIHIWDMEALSFIVWKWLPRLKFLSMQQTQTLEPWHKLPGYSSRLAKNKTTQSMAPPRRGPKLTTTIDPITQNE